MRSSISGTGSFPQSQPHHHPSFPFHSSSFGRKKPTLNAADLSFSGYMRSMDDGDDGRRGESRAEAAAAAPDDTELSIFDARKYFTETSIDSVLDATKKIPPSLPRFSSASSADGFSRHYRTQSFRSYATPTASSEASWNSHTGLLTNPPGAVSVSLRDPKLNRKTRLPPDSPRWLLFRPRCPCYGKKSVRVKESSPEPRTPASRSRSRSHFDRRLGEAAVSSSRIKVEDSKPRAAPKPEIFMEKVQKMATNAHSRFSNGGFTFPVLKPSISSKVDSTVLSSLPIPHPDDPPRESLEVFQPSGDRHPPVASRGSPGEATAYSAIDDDAASDGSSDLFEIESFSTQSNSTSFAGIYGRPRDSLDEARPRFSTAAGGGGLIYGSLDGQSAASTECGYEPSEASVTWSVTTAEGTAFDRGSVTNYSVSASDVEEFTRIQLRQHRDLERGGGVGGGGGGGRRSGGLLTSCRCEKAVSVGPNPVKYTAEKGHAAARERQGSYYRPVM